MLNPRTLRYVRREDGQEIDVTLDEVRQLGEQDADFRRSIGTSTETLNTIVDASIRELEKLRAATGDDKLKIIASALNFEHCRQIVEAYIARGQRAGYIHSREDGAANERVMQKLRNHELGVIVQVRKLGEGFDHPYLAVAAVFNLFSNLSPFVQFVGRIMRVIKNDSPGDPLNNGVVVFHAGANVARRWEDFQQYSEADKEFFDQLLPMEGLDFTSGDELQIQPGKPDDDMAPIDVRAQTDVSLQEIRLSTKTAKRRPRSRPSRKRVTIPTRSKRPLKNWSLFPPPKRGSARRNARASTCGSKPPPRRPSLNAGSTPEGRELDRQRLDRTNLIVVKSAIDRVIAQSVGRKLGERSEDTRPEFDQIDQNFPAIVEQALQEVFSAQN